MGEERKPVRVEWGKVLTNAVSAIVTLVLVGAAMSLWNGYTTMDNRIEGAVAKAIVSHSDLEDAVAVLAPEVDGLKKNQTKIIAALDELAKRDKIPNISLPKSKPHKPTLEMIQQRRVKH